MKCWLDIETKPFKEIKGRFLASVKPTVMQFKLDTISFQGRKFLKDWGLKEDTIYLLDFVNRQLYSIPNSTDLADVQAENFKKEELEWVEDILRIREFLLELFKTTKIFYGFNITAFDLPVLVLYFDLFDVFTDRKKRVVDFLSWVKILKVWDNDIFPKMTLAAVAEELLEIKLDKSVQLSFSRGLSGGDSLFFEEDEKFRYAALDVWILQPLFERLSEVFEKTYQKIKRRIKGCLELTAKGAYKGFKLKSFTNLLIDKYFGGMRNEKLRRFVSQTFKKRGVQDVSLFSLALQQALLIDNFNWDGYLSYQASFEWALVYINTHAIRITDKKRRALKAKLQEVEVEFSKVSKKLSNLLRVRGSLIGDAYRQKVADILKKYNIAPNHKQLTEAGKLRIDAASLKNYFYNLLRLKASQEDIEIIELGLDYKRLGKLKNDLEMLFLQIEDNIYSIYSNFGAPTGRLSVRLPNITQTPRSVKDILFEDLIRVDFAGIELRIMSFLASDTVMYAKFQNNEDLHQFLADRLIKKGILNLKFFSPKEARQIAKGSNFALCYGGSIEALKRFYIENDIDIYQFNLNDVYNGFHATWRGLSNFHRAVEKYIGFCQNKFRGIYAVNILGFPMQVNRKQTFLNYLGQSTGAELLKMAVIKAFHAGLDIRLLIHDEIGIYPTSNEDGKLLTKIMAEVGEKYLGLPVV